MSLLEATKANAGYPTVEQAARAIVALARGCIVQPTGNIIFVQDEQAMIDRIIALATAYKGNR